jgi:hypothetical protein
MPRPEWPSPTAQIANFVPTAADYRRAKLHRSYRERIAHVLGMPKLQDEDAKNIEALIALYRRTRHGHAGTTVGGTLKALRELREAVETAIRTGNLSHQAKAQRLMKRACACHSGLPADVNLRLASCGAHPRPEDVAVIIRDIETQYATMPRITPPTEAFRLFCGWLGLLFAYLVPASVCIGHNFRHRRRRFARAVFDAAGIGQGKLQHWGHPERLDDLLGADVSRLPVPDELSELARNLYLQGGVAAKKV